MWWCGRWRVVCLLPKSSRSYVCGRTCRRTRRVLVLGGQLGHHALGGELPLARPRLYTVYGWMVVVVSRDIYTHARAQSSEARRASSHIGREPPPPTTSGAATHHAIGRRELDLELPLVAEVVVEQVWCHHGGEKQVSTWIDRSIGDVEAGLRCVWGHPTRPPPPFQPHTTNAPAVDRPKSLKNILPSLASSPCVRVVA